LAPLREVGARRGKRGMLNGLDLFSGIGGLSLALNKWVKPIAYCEIDPFCQGVLLSHMSRLSLPTAPLWDDVKTLDGGELRGSVDIVYGGFPCQDISIAGAGQGLEGKRSGLFYEIVRLAKEIRPKYVFLENVPAITSRGGVEVVREIAELGYDARWCIISAASVGAKHRRERWFLLAHAYNNGSLADPNRGSPRKRFAQGKEPYESSENIGETKRAIGLSRDVANTQSERSQEIGQSQRQASQHAFSDDSIEYGSPDQEPENKLELAGMANDVPHRTHRIRALGNAVVPRQAEKAFKILMGIEDKRKGASMMRLCLAKIQN
jgi:DNA (cytosine-5)-methyltransferase 1